MSTQTDAYSFLQPSSHPGDLGMLGDYRILGELGKGGMGYVFRAEHTVLERAVALKVMNKKIASTPNSRDRFLQEARAMAAVHHDNVVVIFEVGTHDGTPFMAMEMLRGETLEAVNSRKEGRDYETVIRYASQIAKGLAAAHAKGIVHRDIKPANIWIEEGSQRVKILDFGLALAQSPLDEFAGVGSVCGTPGYLTPEQARSDLLDDRSDLYSLGVVLYEMCTGRLPIQRPAIAEQLVALLSHAPLPVRELNPAIPQPLSDLIHELLAKEPGDRPKSASALEKQLKKVAVECEAKSETALSLNKLQESLKEVVSKQDEVEEPIEIIEEVPELPTFDPLAMPAIPAAPTNTGPPSSGTRKVGQRIGTPGRPAPKAAPEPVATPVSPVVWLAAGVGITVGIVALAFWMFVLPPKQESFVIQLPETTPSNTPKPTKSSPQKSPQPPENKPAAVNQKGNGGNAQNRNKPKGGKKDPNRNNQNQSNQNGRGKGPGDKSQGAGGKGQGAGATASVKQSKPDDKDDFTKPEPQPLPIKPTAQPDAMVAMKVETNDSASLMNDDPAPSSPDNSVRTIAISTVDGTGADSTVRKRSANLSLGTKPNLAVQMKQDEELQHVYLRFDLQNLPSDRKEVRDAAVHMQLMNSTSSESLTLRLHGTDAAAAEKWTEDGPMSIKWNNSFSIAGLSGLPVLAEFNGPPLSGGVVTFKGAALDEFVRGSKGKSVTLVVAGGQEGNLAALFVSREKTPEEAPTLTLSVPSP